MELRVRVILKKTEVTIIIISLQGSYTLINRGVATSHTSGATIMCQSYLDAIVLYILTYSSFTASPFIDSVVQLQVRTILESVAS